VIDPYIAAKNALIDDIIDPRETRPTIIRGLRMAADKRVERPWKKHGVMPVCTPDARRQSPVASRQSRGTGSAQKPVEETADLTGSMLEGVVGDQAASVCGARPMLDFMCGAASHHEESALVGVRHPAKSLSDVRADRVGAADQLCAERPAIEGLPGHGRCSSGIRKLRRSTVRDQGREVAHVLNRWLAFGSRPLATGDWRLATQPGGAT
jgi:hypothetical protein